MAWLDDLLSQHSELESPMNFWLWGALASISAVAKDNIWLDRHIHYLYPNIYVMLHADSGLKKGPPIAMAKRLVNAVSNTRVITGRSSIQGILKDMSVSNTEPGGKIVSKTASAFICSSELTSSLVGDAVAMDILTDLYDRQYNVGNWRSLLKMEQFNLKDPTITMLTATNEAHSQDFFGKKDIHGGFFARTFIIAEHRRNRLNSLLMPLAKSPNYNELAEYLKIIGKLSGPFRPLASKEQTEEYHVPRRDEVTNELFYYSDAGNRYEEWYRNFADNVDGAEEKDTTGTSNRTGDSVLKVAMLLSLAREPQLVITDAAMADAIKYCEELLANVRQLTYGQHGLSESRHLKARLVNLLIIQSGFQMERKELMSSLWSDYGDHDELDGILATMADAGSVTIETYGSKVYVKLTQKEIQRSMARRGNGRHP